MRTEMVRPARKSDKIEPGLCEHLPGVPLPHEPHPASQVYPVVRADQVYGRTAKRRASGNA